MNEIKNAKELKCSKNEVIGVEVNFRDGKRLFVSNTLLNRIAVSGQVSPVTDTIYASEKMANAIIRTSRK